MTEVGSSTASRYLVAAASALDLVADPRVGDAWEEPSALVGFNVGGLASHLASQVISVADTLDNPVTGPTVDLRGHYDRSRWLGQPLNSEVNVAIRDGGHHHAAIGAATVVDRSRVALDRLRVRLPPLAPGLAVQAPWLEWSLRLDDFLTVRQVEIVVHSDDLAVSVGRSAPDLPPEVTTPVLALPTQLAVRRHGVTALVRALSRAERAPATISGL